MSDKTKFLNLDDISEGGRTIQIKGVTYDVLDMSVENFIETTRKAEALEHETSESVKIEATIEMLTRYIPEAPTDILRKLSFTKLNVLLRFVNGNYDEAGEKPAAEGAVAGEVEKK